jgi:twitching motility protein PilT
MTIQELLQHTLDKDASDLHLIVGSPPTLRIHGELAPLESEPVLDAKTAEVHILGTMNKEQQTRYLATRELDYSISLPGKGRFRANAYFQKQTMALACRSISEVIPTIDSLKLPKICHTFATLKQGFVLVTGPTGSGKSSTLAAIIDEINASRAEHIVTIEDPMEFIYKNNRSVISQRELGSDTLTWGGALKSVLREDPNVVLVGEMRDPETMSAAITVAETGHLVFATLHTNSAAQTVDRIIDSFPEDQQAQIRMQLSNSLEAVFSQRLVPAIAGGRVVAAEVLVATPAVRNTIREAKTHQLDSIIQTSAELGMMTLETSLAYWINQGVVDFAKAREISMRPAELERLLRR